MSEHYRVLRKATTATGDFLPASEGGGPCKAFAVSSTTDQAISVTTSHGVVITVRTDGPTEPFKIFPIAGVTWAGAASSAEIITLF